MKPVTNSPSVSSSLYLITQAHKFLITLARYLGSLGRLTAPGAVEGTPNLSFSLFYLL
jgi:hypothetical protein